MVIASWGHWRQYLIAMALVMTLAPARTMAAQTCPPAPAAQLRMTTTLPKPSYRHELTRPQIGALGGSGHMSSDTRHAGLTRADTDFALQPHFQFERAANGATCGRLLYVEVRWQMTVLMVDIAAEYNRASCAYAEIWRHENQHVAFSQNRFMEADRALRVALGKIVSGTGAFLVRTTPQRVQEETADRLLAVAEPILARYRQDLNRDNASIDTLQSYRAVGARCKDW